MTNFPKIVDCMLRERDSEYFSEKAFQERVTTMNMNIAMSFDERRRRRSTFVGRNVTSLRDMCGNCSHGDGEASDSSTYHQQRRMCRLACKKVLFLILVLMFCLLFFFEASQNIISIFILFILFLFLIKMFNVHHPLKAFSR